MNGRKGELGDLGSAGVPGQDGIPGQPGIPGTPGEAVGLVVGVKSECSDPKLIHSQCAVACNIRDVGMSVCLENCPPCLTFGITRSPQA